MGKRSRGNVERNRAVRPGRRGLSGLTARFVEKRGLAGQTGPGGLERWREEREQGEVFLGLRRRRWPGLGGFDLGHPFIWTSFYLSNVGRMITVTFSATALPM